MCTQYQHHHRHVKITKNNSHERLYIKSIQFENVEMEIKEQCINQFLKRKEGNFP